MSYSKGSLGFYIFFTLSILTLSSGLSLDLSDESANLGSESLVGAERLLLLAGSGNNGINLTTLAALAALAAAAILPALGLAALCLLLWAVLSQQMKDSGYGTGHHGGYSSYSSNYRSFDVADTDWESLSIIDWIQVAQETFSTFKPSSIECQKKVVCELFQNADVLGSPALNFKAYFSYLNYAEVFSLPENLKEIADELLSAAEVGKTLQKECDTIFGGCKFSLKEILTKYGHGRFMLSKHDNSI